MATTNDFTKQMAQLPKAARAAMEQAMKSGPTTIAESRLEKGKKFAKEHELVDAALEAVGFDDYEKLPLAKDLTESQRALAEILARLEGFTNIAHLPHLAYWRRRWLGLEQPGALEKTNKKGVPLWKELLDAEDAEDDALLSRKLPLEDRLQIWWDISCGAYGLGFAYSDLKWGELDEIKGKQPKVAELAARCLDAASSKGGNEPKRQWSWPFFKALWLAKQPFKPEWDAYFPTPMGKGYEKWPFYKEKCALYKDWIASLPEERRASAIIASLGTTPNDQVSNGLTQLKDFPSAALSDFVIEASKHPWSDFKLARVQKELKALGIDTKNRIPVGPVLTIAKKRKPKKLAELSPLEQKQLVAAGIAYDGKKLSAEARMSTAKKDVETSFVGSLEIRDVVDAKKKPVYVVFLYGADSGSIFEVGKTKEVAGISQSSLECSDLKLKSSLQSVID